MCLLKLPLQGLHIAQTQAGISYVAVDVCICMDTYTYVHNEERLRMLDNLRTTHFVTYVCMYVMVKGDVFSMRHNSIHQSIQETRMTWW